MRNWQRWGLSILIGFGAGSIEAASDPKANLSDIVRHGFISLAPTLAALKMTLNQDESAVSPPDKVFKAGA